LAVLKEDNHCPIRLVQLNFSFGLLAVQTGFVFHEPQRAQRAQRGDEKRINEIKRCRFIADRRFRYNTKSGK
jgi:hypothetical protein